VVPSDWAMRHPMIGPYHTVNVQSTYSQHAQSAAMSPLYIQVTCPITYNVTYHIATCRATSSSILHRHLATSASVQPSSHPYCHVSFFHWATSCTDCHVSNPYRCHLSLKTPNLSDMCHLLVMSCQHDDIITISC
jgi:hypothetical protein